MKRIVIAIMAAIATLGAMSQEVTIDSLAARLAKQVYTFPQEKIHVMTDRADYFGGDTIWFRAFVVDASTHKPVKMSKYVYAELKNPFDTVVNRVKIMERDGVYAGYLPIDAHIAEGDYTLTAYTMFMDNVGPDYFFRKSISITSPFAVQSVITPRFEWEGDNLAVNVSYTDKATGEHRSYENMTYTTANGTERQRTKGSKAVNFKLKPKEMQRPYVLVSFGSYSKFLRLPPKEDGTYWVSFHPEGGYLIPGEPCRLAFKAIDTRGLSTQISGRVTNEAGDSIAPIVTRHRGMGVIDLTPEAGVKYTAEVKNSDGVAMTFALPGANPDAAVLRVEQDSTMLEVSARGNVKPGMFIILQQRGQMLAASAIEPGKAEMFKKEWFPAGVMQILLLDSANNTLSERLVFIREQADRHVDITTEIVN